MKMQIFTCFALIITTTLQVTAQAPVIKWQKTYGGTDRDDIDDGTKISLIDRDGKYIIGCSTNSNNGDMTDNHSSRVPYLFAWDAWMAKVDVQGDKIWSTCVGYAYNEDLYALKLAHDSGYIMIGSNSSASPVRSLPNVWVVRLGSTGNVVWAKQLGGTYNDVGRNITPIPDGYVLTGITVSNDRDVDWWSYHGTPGIVNYAYDIWVVKIDKSGNILWNKCLGGYGVEFATDIQPTADGGFVVIGSTTSNDGDVHGNHGSTDVWIVKLDATGTIQWQKCLGGTGSDGVSDIEFMADGGYIIAGKTDSQDGDVAGYHVTDTTFATSDAWVVRLSATGDLLWQKCFGGSRDDAFNDIQLLPDQNIVAVGTTNSTNGDVSLNHGKRDCWLVKFTPTGNLIWETTYGTAVDERGVTLAALPSGNFLIEGNTYITYAPYQTYADVWLFEVGPEIVGGPLPVTLLSFNATQSNSEVNITWKTGLEQNFSHFEVQRSANGIDFTTIGIVQANPPSYLFIDKQPLPGLNYYRLKSVDLDGTYSNSTIATVNLKEGTIIVSSLYPNPGHGKITLQLRGAVHGHVTMQVFDQYGSILSTRQFGNQHTKLFSAPVDLSHLPHGNYIVKVMVDDEIYLNKLLIQ